MKKNNKKIFGSKKNELKQSQSRRKALQIIGSSAAIMLGGGLRPSLLEAAPVKLHSFDSLKSKNSADLFGAFKYFIGIVGNPSSPEIEWSDAELMKIKDLGVNMLQLSIAWGGKPANEVLNLEDLDADQLKKWSYRVKQAKKFGFKTIAQFGAPRMLNSGAGYGVVEPACIMDPAIREKYANLLRKFLDGFPEVENILVYTFDQQAWLCSEYGPCPRCSGLELHERLPGFLDYLNSAMQKSRPGSKLWWKPWELTKGQTQMVLQNVNAGNFGLVLNPSTCNEVYPFNDRSFKSDLGIKRLVHMAVDRNIPVVGEFDHTLYKGYYLIADYFPRLVYEQLQGWKDLEGVIGIKEYFGFAPSQFSVNAAMLKTCMQFPNEPVERLLERVAAPYGEREAPLMIQAWENIARGVEAFPWDVTYLIGPMGLDKNNDGSHGWEPVSIPNGTWNTPIWKSNRRANFMLTEDFKAHPWLFEDAGLRLEDSASYHYKAVELLDKAASFGGKLASDIKMQSKFIYTAARAIRGTSLHFLETLASQDARLVSTDKKQLALVINRLDSLLVKDVENQKGSSEVTKKLEDFRKDPKIWLNSNFNPRTYESICTIDWNTYVPFQGR